MTRFINTTLIGLVAFIVILALLWLVIDPRAPGLATTATGDDDFTVRDATADWDASSTDGTDLVVAVVVHNDGESAFITQAAYRVMLDDQLLAAATTEPKATVPPGMDGTVRLHVDLPPDFSRRWFDAYQHGDETVSLHVEGTLVARTAALDSRVPFTWSSTWRGHLLERLAAGAQDCPGPPAPLCLDDLDTAFRQGNLLVTLDLRNDRADPVNVRNGTFRLMFQDVAVATGRMEGDHDIAAGAHEDIPVTLTFDDAALAQWWAGHVARCEDSRLSLAVNLESEAVGGDGGAELVAWDILAAPFVTGFACGSGV